MRIFKTKWFNRYSKQKRISDDVLFKAVARAEAGIIDADLGGGIIKQRVARPGQGCSGGFRFLICYRRGKLALFLYGFAKNERDNIEPDELATLREIGAAWLDAKKEQVENALKQGVLVEVQHEIEE